MAAPQRRLRRRKRARWLRGCTRLRTWRLKQVAIVMQVTGVVSAAVFAAVFAALSAVLYAASLHHLLVARRVHPHRHDPNHFPSHECGVRVGMCSDEPKLTMEQMEPSTSTRGVCATLMRHLTRMLSAESSGML